VNYHADDINWFNRECRIDPKPSPAQEVILAMLNEAEEQEARERGLANLKEAIDRYKAENRPVPVQVTVSPGIWKALGMWLITLAGIAAVCFVCWWMER
jgi:hypothetical protein